MRHISPIFVNFVTRKKNRYTVCDDQDRVLPTDETKFVQLDTFVVQTGFFSLRSM